MKIKPLLDPAKTGNKRALRRHPGGGPGRRGAAQQPPGIGGDPVRRVGRGRRHRSAARRSRSAPRRRCTSRTASRTRRNSPARRRRSCYRCSRPPDRRSATAPPSRRASNDKSDDDQMIDFELSEDQRVLQASVREMCERLIIPNARRWDAGREVPARDRAGDGRDGPARDADPGGLRRRRDEVPRLRRSRWKRWRAPTRRSG